MVWSNQLHFVCACARACVCVCARMCTCACARASLCVRGSIKVVYRFYIISLIIATPISQKRNLSR